MKINTIPKQVIMKSPIYNGKYYAFVNYSGLATSWDGTKDIDIDLRESVLFTKKHLKKFRPNDNTHDFLRDMLEHREIKIKELTKLAKTCKHLHKERTGEVIEYKKLVKEQLQFLKDHTIIFVEINFELSI